MAVRVKVLMTINIDESEYPMPGDERVDEEVQGGQEAIGTWEDEEELE